MSFAEKAKGVRGFDTRFSLIWCERVHSRSSAMMRSTSSDTLRLALMRTTSFSWMMRALDRRGGDEAVRVAHEQQALGRVAEHGAPDLLRDGHLPELRVERQELLLDHLLAGLLVEAVGVLHRGVDRDVLRAVVGLEEEHVVGRAARPRPRR